MNRVTDETTGDAAPETDAEGQQHGDGDNVQVEADNVSIQTGGDAGTSDDE